MKMRRKEHYAYPENPNYHPIKSTIKFFTKISLACSILAMMISFLYTNSPVRINSLMYQPLLISIVHACIYYPFGYVLYNLYENDYFPSFKQPRPRIVNKQKMDWQLLGVLKGEFIGLIMNYFFFGIAVKVGGIQYDFSSPASINFGLVGFCKLFCWFLFAIWWADLSFFTLHYWFHSSPWLYRVIHKKHHRFQYQVGWSAEEKTVTESVLVSTAELFPHLIFGGHMVYLLTWIIVGVVYSIEVHSGYGLFFVDKFGFHDWHHTTNTGNYGTGFYLDHLFNTSKNWRNWIEDYSEKQADD